jgi:hypothetical protein
MRRAFRAVVITHFRMRWVLVVAVLATLTRSAGAECQLTPPTPIDDAALHHNALEEVWWSYLSPILRSEDDQRRTLIDPLHPKRQADVSLSVTLGVTTPSRGLAVEAYQPGKLFIGPLAPGARLRAAYTSQSLARVLDAVDGAAGETWVVLSEQPLKRALGLYLHRISAASQVSAGSAVATGRVWQARIARFSDGRFAVAFAVADGGRRYSVSALWVAFFDRAGKPLGAAQRLDSVLGEQVVLDVALAASGSGAVVAWNPIVHVPKGKVDSVPVELRAFHVEPGRAPQLTRRDALSAVVWRIPEAGGILPNQVQAASVSGQAVLVWQEIVNEQTLALMAAPAEGGAPTAIMTNLDRSPLLRSDGNALVIALWDRNAYKHGRAVLTCATGLPGPAPKPLEPAPASPTTSPLTRSDFDKLWQHLSLVASTRAASELRRALGALTPSARAAAEAALTTDEATSEYLYDCVLAARSVDELAECHWDP